MKRLLLIFCLFGLVTSAAAQKKEMITLTDELTNLNKCVDSLKTVCAQNNATMEQLMSVLHQLIASNMALGADCSSMKKEYAGLQQSIENLASLMSLQSYEIKQETPSCGRTLVRQGVLFGYVDNSGKMVIPAEYEEGYEFVENVACVRKNDEWGIVDLGGKVVVPIKYEDMHHQTFSRIIPVKEKGRWGAIDRKGQEVIPFNYDSVVLWSSGYWEFKKGTSSDKYSFDGKLK